MAKKPGLMNDDKNMQSMDPMHVANTMAKAAHIKVQKMGKTYMQDDALDGEDNTGHPNKSAAPMPKGGATHPSAPPLKPSKYSGEMNTEMSGGTDSPSKRKGKK